MTTNINKVVLRPDLHAVIKRRAWHMWGMTIVIGICILLGSAHIASALWSVCPEHTGIELSSA